MRTRRPNPQIVDRRGGLPQVANEATGGLRGHRSAREQIEDSLAAGTSPLLWEVEGQPVAWASATAPTAGMSRIGPVYTPPAHRGRGYGRAITAADAVEIAFTPR